MIRIAGMLLLAACGLLVLWAEGLHWLAVWNLVPLLVADRAVARGTGPGRLSCAALTFAAVTALTVVLVHAAWVFDWGGTRTGSSTAGLIFLFSPILVLLLGGCAWAVVKPVERFVRKGRI